MSAHDDYRRAEARVKRAHRCFVDGDLSGAERELRKAIEIDPTRGDWRFNLAMVLEVDGRIADALSEFVAAAEALPTNTDALMGAGRCSAALNRHQDCLDWMQRVVKLDSKSEPAHACIITALGMLDRDDEAEQAYFLAQQCLERYPWCLRSMGELLVKRGDLDRAIWCFREAVQQSPSGVGLKTRYAEVLQAKGDHARAAKVFLQALRDTPGDEQTLLGYGSALMSLGRAREAAEKYRRVVELNPANTRAHVMLAQLAMEAGRFEEARGEYSVAIALGDFPPAARICSAQSMIACGDLAAAKAELNEELDRPDGAQRLAVIARHREAVLAASATALTCGAYAFARRILELALPLGSTDAELLGRLARVHFTAGDVQSGLRVTRRQLVVDRNSAVGLHNFALACLRGGKHRAAWAAVHRARKSCPRDAGIRQVRWLLMLAAIRTSFRAAIS